MACSEGGVSIADLPAGESGKSSKIAQITLTIWAHLGQHMLLVKLLLPGLNPDLQSILFRRNWATPVLVIRLSNFVQPCHWRTYSKSMG